jgi:hypothetical protein
MKEASIRLHRDRLDEKRGLCYAGESFNGSTPFIRAITFFTDG